MRVIAGTARRLQLKTIEGMDTRPTTDRIKETLFNMIQYDVAGSLFLDLFGGSGAIGIEALSRGAKHAVFVEQNPKAAACIRENLKITRLEDRAEVLVCDVMEGLRRLESAGACFDLIFMDPPYRCGLEEQVLGRLADSCLVGPDTTIIVEAALDTELTCVDSLGFEIQKIKTYKTNQHFFLVRGEVL